MKAILFDLDDTLYRERDFVEGGFSAAALFLEKRYGLPAAHTTQRLGQLMDSQGRGKIFDQLLNEYELYAPELTSLLVFIYRTHTPQIRLSPSDSRQLYAWRDKGIQLGLITDGIASVQQRKIAALGLPEIMKVCICTEEMGANCSKPSVRPFQLALDLLQVTVQETMYVGDNDAKDFEGANRVGLYTTQLTKYLTPRQEPANELSRARMRIGDLADINTILLEKNHV